MIKTFCRWTSLFLVLLVAFSQGNATLRAGEPSRETAGAVQFVFGSTQVNEAAGQATIELKRPDGIGTMIVGYQISNNTATAGPDYVGTTGTVTVVFNDGELSKTIVIPIINDLSNEDIESFFVDLTEGASGRCTVIIVDDDPQPTISINDVSVIEGSSGTTNAVFTVALSEPSGKAFQLDYATGVGTAGYESGDFYYRSGTLNFNVDPTTGIGPSTQTISVEVRGDVINEADETFTMVLSSSDPLINASIADGEGVGTIVNDDPAPTVSIDNKAVTEGDSGTANIMFTVTLSAASGQAIVVNYALTGNTATAGSDFVATPGTLTIPVGLKKGFINVAVNGDMMYELQETFFVNISSPNNLFPPRQGTGTINDNNDPIPTISISSMPVTEGNSGTTVAPFVVTLSNPSYQEIRVLFATANGTATAGFDYVAQDGELVFAPGEVSKTINVVVNGDVNFEQNESLVVNLSSASNATLAVAQAEDQIMNDDLELPSISINSFAVTETNKGFVNALLTVTLSSASTQTVSVKYATADGTAKAACDYVAATGTLSFAPGVTSMVITVKVHGERKKEINETFTVNLSNPVNGLLGTSAGVVTIVNDDGLPKLTIAGEHMEEGNDGIKPMVFSVRLHKKPSSTVTVDYTTADGTALAGSDYTSTSGTLTFATGETVKNISVAVLGDLLFERDELFTVRLSNPAAAKIQDGSANGTIRNDESRPVLTVSNATVDEGNSGTVPAEFTVLLSNPSSEIITVKYATENGSAYSPGDYAATSGTLTFNPGETVQSFSVSVNGDLVTERNEEFFVRLSRADNASIRDAKGTGSIQNDDAPSIASRFEDLIAYIQGLPADAFRKPSEKSRSALIDGLNDANRAFQRGNNNSAKSNLRDALNRINATGNSGWLVQDAVRQDLYTRVFDLSIVLDQAASLAKKDVQVFELSEDIESPMNFGLEQNYPNPFNPTTTIQYTLREPAMVSLKVYDMVGREVANLVQANQGPGRHSVQFNGEHLTSGTYIYRILAGSFRETKKLTLMK